MSDEPRKRSRFDQTEPEPKRASRFDRRSRSPSARKSESRRSRSPLDKSPSSSDVSKSDPAAAAAAAAARINAQLHAKKGFQPESAQAIRSSSTGAKSDGGEAKLNGDIYQQDGDYVKDIEVNDLRNKYTLTKGATQKMINDETGADVTTRGSYFPDKSMATPTNPPLYLHVTSQTKEGLERAIAKIEELMKQELPNLIDERRFRRPREVEQVERDELGRRKWPEERIPIDLEPIPGFNLRAQVVGHGGAYVKHIQGETRCRVQIKGRGSGFTEHGTGVESDEPMYLHVAGPDPNEVKRAKELCEDLLANVKEQYQNFKERSANRQSYHGGSGDYDRHNSYGGGGRDHGRGGGYGHRDNRDGGYGGQQSPAPAAQAAGAGSPTDYSAQYAQYYGTGQDPYAAYGGYQAYMQMYYQWYQQQQQADPNAAAAPGAESAPGAPPSGPPGIPGAPGAQEQPPPPPGTESQPPPPPPPSGTPSGYNSVPPPPGM